MLHIENLSFSYHGQKVLDQFSLDISEGECVGIVGPNGVGKTTLINLISGVLNTSSNQIIVSGIDVTKLSADERARLISTVPQNPYLPTDFTVLDLVLMGRNPHLRLLEWEGERDFELCNYVMKLTDTISLSDRKLHTLSGGERQRATIAMALAQEAPILLLDEPTANLDIAHQSEIMNLVKQIQKQRSGAILIAMHDLTLAALYCDRVLMLERDGICYEGLPSKVLTADNIANVYDCEVCVFQHPQTSTPVVVPLLVTPPTCNKNN